jgi:death-on-curing protein
MEEIGRVVIYPIFEEILTTNRRQIARTGGLFIEPDNLRDASGLHWVLDFIQHPVFYGQDLCPTVSEKATQLTWKIIAGHVFNDGGKRTGMTALLQFLDRNGFALDISENEIVDQALLIARAGEEAIHYTVEEHLAWIRTHLRLKMRSRRRSNQLDLLQEHYRQVYDPEGSGQASDRTRNQILREQFGSLLPQ